MTIYVVHHPQCSLAEKLASRLFEWFRLASLSTEASAAGLPVYFRRQLAGSTLHPTIRFDDAGLNVVIVLVDHRMVGDLAWRKAVVELAEKIDEIRDGKSGGGRAILLPGAMHESFYRTGPLYQNFNPVRLLQMTDEQMEATIRRAATEAIARDLRADGSNAPPPLNVFLSHAKRDGTPIAEAIRDGVRSFSQLVAWYDANDLPIGSEWKSPMEKAARDSTAAMVATVTDAYPTRPWCRREAKLARTPMRVNEKEGRRVWKVQPVVAVHQAGCNWVRGVPMLEGVPRIGWQGESGKYHVERIVDRLVLEVLLANVHCRAALNLDERLKRPDSCYITWIPDAWTLAALRQEMQKTGIEPASVQQIMYPGYGLTFAEINELEPVFKTFHDETRLVSFEEAWQ
ncbi:MAG: TIR domain-containing protein [Pirellulaceae bacterium]|nr:TIR domain-containing protein [Pirellulaceae bacterium]